MKFLPVITLLAAGILWPQVHGQDDGTTVQTQQGPVTGILSSGVRQFLGIPYAVANRWEAPQPPPSRTVTLQATSFGSSCVQSILANNMEFLTLIGLGGQSVEESEDCLNVNVWAPSVERKQGTAVMLWIYGGSFAFGTSDTSYYEGQNIVRDNDDVLVVSFNYRLNIFGQPNAPQLTGTSESVNYGFLDLRAAVQWVHANIAAFGGDPERIILFGESAGSISADAYLFANPSDAIVKGVIEESGSLAGNSILVPQTDITSVNAWNTVAFAVGCGAVATPLQLACMKAMPFRTLQNAIINTEAQFAPTPDGVTYFSDATARSAAGKFLHVPLLVGNTAQEGDIFVVGLEELGFGFSIPGLTQTGSDVVTQLMFSCPAGTTAGDHARAGDPTWRYRYEAIFPDISSRPDLRSFHASEILIVFGTYNSSGFSTLAAPTPNEVALSKYVQQAWVAFARDPAKGLTNYGWPSYSPSTNSLVQLGSPTNASGVSFALGDVFDTGCTVTEASIALGEQIFGLTGVL